MKQPLIKWSLGFIILTTGVACARVPVGAFGVAGSESGNSISLNTDHNTLEEQKLKRLSQIDQKIQESSDRLNAILDPNQNSAPADLEKLVVGEKVDPSLSYDRRFNAGQIIEQKMDQKAQDLISGSASTASSVTSTAPESLTDPSLLNDRQLRNQAEIDANLNAAADGGTKKSSEDKSSEEDTADTEVPSTPSASPAL